MKISWINNGKIISEPLYSFFGYLFLILSLMLNLKMFLMKNVKNVVIETVLVQFSIINHMMHTIKGLKQVHLNCTKKLFFSIQLIYAMTILIQKIY